MTAQKDITILREVEVNWLTDSLGVAIANLGYPVGCGVAPNREQLLRAASTLIDRYLLMVEMAAGQRDALNAEIKQLRAERDALKADMKHAYEILERNLGHQTEKCYDAVHVLRNSLEQNK